MTSLKEKVAMVFKAEPEKSLIKAGLLSPEGFTTDDGVAIYVGYLMRKDTQFKTDVVDPILADQTK